MTRSRIPSCAALFEKRGDPWVSPREGLDTFARSVYEEPDLDQFTKATRAKPRFDRRPEKTASKNIVGDDRKRLTNIRRRLHSSLNRETHIVVKPSPISPQIQALGNTRSPRVVGFSVYVRRNDGTETEADRATDAQARLLMGRRRGEKDVVAVEIWSYTTGDCVAKWERRAKPRETKA